MVTTTTTTYPEPEVLIPDISCWLPQHCDTTRTSRRPTRKASSSPPSKYNAPCGGLGRFVLFMSLELLMINFRVAVTTAQPMANHTNHRTAAPGDAPSLIPTHRELSDLPSWLPTLAPTPTLTAPPSHAPTRRSPCSICGADEALTLPKRILYNFNTGTNMTCAEAQQRGQQGDYATTDCKNLQDAYRKYCGCQPLTSSATSVTTSSKSQTKAPTPSDSVLVSSTILITLYSVSDVMPNGTQKTYESVCTQFYSTAFAAFHPPIINVMAQLLDQQVLQRRRRRQQQQVRTRNLAAVRNRGLQLTLPPLQTLVRVTGQGGNLDSTNLQLSLELALNNNVTGFITLLHDTTNLDAIYFSNVQKAMAQATEVFTPPPTPTPQGNGNGNNNPTGGGGGGSSGLSTGAIVGIAVGGGVFVILLGMGAYYSGKGSASAAASSLASSDMGTAGQSSSPPRQQHQFETSTISSGPPGSNIRKSTSSSVAAVKMPASSSVVDPNSKLADAAGEGRDSSLADSSSGLDPDFALSSSPSMQLDEGIETDEYSDYHTLQGAASVMNESEYGGDSMSYAYSLDAGNVDQPTVGGGAVGSSSVLYGPTGGASGIGTADSTLADENTTVFSGRTNLVSREVLAPPGKLGIVIDTTLEGPVVHKVNPNSPLEGSIFPGDIIVAIDDVDTRAMSASAITALMVKTANQRRRLTVLSEDAYAI